MATDILDVVYRLRDMAGRAADRLRVEIDAAQELLDRLDRFAHDAEETAQLAAASDLFPGSSALIPEGAGLIRPAGPDLWPIGYFLGLKRRHQLDVVHRLGLARDGDANMPQATYGPVLAERINREGLVARLREVVEAMGAPTPEPMALSVDPKEQQS